MPENFVDIMTDGLVEYSNALSTLELQVKASKIADGFIEFATALSSLQARMNARMMATNVTCETTVELQPQDNDTYLLVIICLVLAIIVLGWLNLRSYMEIRLLKRQHRTYVDGVDNMLEMMPEQQQQQSQEQEAEEEERIQKHKSDMPRPEEVAVSIPLATMTQQQQQEQGKIG
jgi:hypothetical protein